MPPAPLQWRLRTASEEMTLEVIDHERRHGRTAFTGPAGLVRLKNDVVHRLQCIGDVRLARKNIQRCRAEISTLQGFDQGGLVDDRPARDIDQGADGPNASSTARLIVPTVCGVAAQVTTRKSDSAAMASRLSTKRFGTPSMR